MANAQPIWLKRLVRWLRGVLGASVYKGSLKILEEYHTDHFSLLLIHDPNVPGCIDLWRIDRHKENVKFFLLLINPQEFRADLTRLGVGQRDIVSTRTGGLVDGLLKQIQTQKNITASHYWITGWQEEFSAVDRKGRAFHSHRVRHVDLLAVDLQGAAGYYAGDRYARRYARKIIEQLANSEFREYSYHATWQAAVRSIDWAKWLEGASRNPKSGIDPNHVLQPPRSKRLSQ